MIICVRCGRIMRVKKNGVPFVELREDGTPYKLWESDQWECEDCGASVLHTTSTQRPIAERYQENFDHQLESLAPTISAKQRGPRSKGRPATVRNIEWEADRMYDQEGRLK